MQAIEAIDRKIAKVTRELTNTNGSHLGKTLELNKLRAKRASLAKNRAR
ncbi:hypothetical protein U47_06 [Pseudomonas phage U47]|nr:hypothetical protein U47_06 [Pseudomonas phage U47]UYE90134.1 hypothetical protein [Pseudomonas phage PaeP_Ls]